MGSTSSNRQGRVRSLAKEGASTRERIVHGGADAIGKLGVARSRVEDVLKSSGVSRPTFYHHFDSKEALLVELSARHHGEVRQRLLDAFASKKEAADQVVAAVEAFLQWRADLGAIGRVLDLEARTPGSVIAEHRRRTQREIVRLSSALLEAHSRPMADPVIWYALMAGLESIADQLLSGARPTEKARRRANALGHRLLLAALALPGEDVPPLLTVED